MFKRSKVAGALIFIGAFQFLLSMIVAESIYPGYSIQWNYISDLGVGSTSLIFNTSIIFLGIFLLLAAYLLDKAWAGRWFTFALVMTAIGAIGVGVFNERSPLNLHVLFSLITFAFGGISAIMSSRIVKPPFSFISALVGSLGLVALVFFAINFYPLIGPGGMERMIAYPILIWGLAFGGYLMAADGG
ncbi:MAG: DUF998 domain-containing protein [Nitrososphaerota archaeon]|nr:DUF998 domain-containing protein [Nitrososphaerota archaeon]MDG7046165.1 DUF998 domain-containing protein [Nitrososphaerota archaeon]